MSSGRRKKAVTQSRDRSYGQKGRESEKRKVKRMRKRKRRENENHSRDICRDEADENAPASFIGDQINLQSRFVIVGYIRRVHEMDYIVPEDVVQVCASFYLGREYFACHGDSYHLDLDRTTITKTTGKKTYADLESAFGHIAVPSMSDKIHIWTFKVLQCQECMCFGITDYWDCDAQRDCFLAWDTHNYCAQHPEGTRSRALVKCAHKYDGFRIEPGSVVRMELNLMEQMLSFYLGDTWIGPAYGHIECGEDITYKMAVRFRDKACKVQLLRYTEKLEKMPPR